MSIFAGVLGSSAVAPMPMPPAPFRTGCGESSAGPGARGLTNGASRRNEGGIRAYGSEF